MRSELFFETAEFVGEIPTEFGRLTLIDHYGPFLYSNKFSGEIPTQFGQLSRLTYGPDFHSNRLTGTVPTEMGMLSKVEGTFNLALNSLSGMAPTELGQLVQIANDFVLSQNLLSGVPTQLGMLTKLTGNFDLHANSLCEGLPTEVAALSNMVQYEWKVTTGNEDLCGTYDDDGRGGASKDGGGGGSKISDVGAVLISGGSMVTVLALAWIARRFFGSVPISDGDTVSTCSTLDSDYLELAPGPRSRRGGRNGDAGNVGGAGDVSGDNENNQEDPLYASWKSSGAEIVVFDDRLRVVLWSKGLAQASSFDPAQGDDLTSFPFPSPEHRAKLTKSLHEVRVAATDPMFPVQALHAAVLAEPSMIMHLGGVGVQHEAVVISMAAVKIYPLASSWSAGAAAGAWVSGGSDSQYHILLMGHGHLDPGLTSLWENGSGGRDGHSDAMSDLTSETGSGLMTFETYETTPSERTSGSPSAANMVTIYEEGTRGRLGWRRWVGGSGTGSRGSSSVENGSSSNHGSNHAIVRRESRTGRAASLSSVESPLHLFAEGETMPGETGSLLYSGGESGEESGEGGSGGDLEGGSVNSGDASVGSAQASLGSSERARGSMGGSVGSGSASSWSQRGSTRSGGPGATVTGYTGSTPNTTAL
mmetsp:Transcript_12264/g.28667  ORF Transcript_12264/g.28667 Transcript_12264/m.28667 type:complete len:646 (+) Transcript_12264:1682-3619(+)